MKKFTYNLSVLNNQDEISYYLLGAFMTDGHVPKNKERISLTSADKDWLLLVANMFSTGLNIRKVKHANVYVLDLNNKEIVNWFISKGCTPNKSLTLKFPQMPKQYLPDFIRGCIDGDGSIGIYPYKKYKNNKEYLYYRKQIYFCSSSLSFISNMKKILHSKKFSFSYFECKPRVGEINGRKIIPKNKHYRLTFGDKSAYELINWIYYPKHLISMPRKNNIAQQIIKLYD